MNKRKAAQALLLLASAAASLGALCLATHRREHAGADQQRRRRSAVALVNLRRRDLNLDELESYRTKKGQGCHHHRDATFLEFDSNSARFDHGDVATPSYDELVVVADVRRENDLTELGRVVQSGVLSGGITLSGDVVVVVVVRWWTKFEGDEDTSRKGRSIYKLLNVLARQTPELRVKHLKLF